MKLRIRDSFRQRRHRKYLISRRVNQLVLKTVPTEKVHRNRDENIITSQKFVDVVTEKNFMKRY